MWRYPILVNLLLDSWGWHVICLLVCLHSLFLFLLLLLGLEWWKWYQWTCFWELFNWNSPFDCHISCSQWPWSTDHILRGYSVSDRSICLDCLLDYLLTFFETKVIQSWMSWIALIVLVLTLSEPRVLDGLTIIYTLVYVSVNLLACFSRWGNIILQRHCIFLFLRLRSFVCDIQIGNILECCKFLQASSSSWVS